MVLHHDHEHVIEVGNSIAGVRSQDRERASETHHGQDLLEMHMSSPSGIEVSRASSGPRAELAPEPHTSFAESAFRVLRLRGDPVNVTRRHHRLTGVIGVDAGGMPARVLSARAIHIQRLADASGLSCRARQTRRAYWCGPSARSRRRYQAGKPDAGDSVELMMPIATTQEPI
jgi:hypothetical protein